jgi:hypothetical protein
MRTHSTRLRSEKGEDILIYTGINDLIYAFDTNVRTILVENDRLAPTRTRFSGFLDNRSTNTSSPNIKVRKRSEKVVCHETVLTNRAEVVAGFLDQSLSLDTQQKWLEGTHSAAINADPYRAPKVMSRCSMDVRRRHSRCGCSDMFPSSMPGRVHERNPLLPLGMHRNAGHYSKISTRVSLSLSLNSGLSSTQELF